MDLEKLHTVMEPIGEEYAHRVEQHPSKKFAVQKSDEIVFRDSGDNE